jgi:hypothetical protein
VIQARVDHLVVLASSLAQGQDWCLRTLGVAPGPGGQHPLMGTHNQLLRIATVDYPRAYLEIIAVDPAADATARRPGKRWFDMDDEALAQAVRQHGPRLVHFVAGVPQIEAALQAFALLDLDRGEALQASRMTPKGLLKWRIAVRPDGQRLLDGCLPTLIEWGDVHPAAGMADAGLHLQSVTVSHPQAPRLGAAFEAIGLHGVAVAQGPANLCAVLQTPKGRVRLESGGL